MYVCVRSSVSTSSGPYISFFSACTVSSPAPFFMLMKLPSFSFEYRYLFIGVFSYVYLFI